MPTPDDGSFYIEINDFSPGIHSDRHGSDPPRFTAADDNAAVNPRNGMARIAGTSRCHADAFGALVPLPKAQPTGTRDNITPALDLQPMRPFRYLLDAQIGNVLVDGSETEVEPHPEPSRQLLQVVWGMYVVPES